jgi:hypothetical protein
MRKLLLVLLVILAAVALEAGTLTGAQTTLTAQDTYIQQTLVPIANAAKCARYGLGPSCTSANLVSAGCVVIAFSTLTRENLTFNACTIYTLDGTGANGLAAEKMAQAFADMVASELNNDVEGNCTAFKALTLAQRNQVCTDLGRPNGCRVCR